VNPLSSSISRRQFLEAAAIGGAAAWPLAGEPSMPTRVLGRTGVRVSILTFGAGSRFLGLKRDQAIAALHRGLDLGINYIDTGENYGDGESEQRIGEVMRSRRSGVFLATKLEQRDCDGAMRAIEGSLKRLQTDHVDLVQIHHLDGADDLAKVSAKGGAHEAVTRIRDQKMARFIGITSHTDPVALRAALERHDFDCTLMALNAAQRGGAATGMHAGFETTALPAAVRKNMGIMAMKAFAQDELTGQAPPEKLIYYCLSLPVATVVIGMPTLQILERNVDLVRRFQPLAPGEMDRLARTLSTQKKASLDAFFRGHRDA
jgi:aryl-alcohol dehydrogenase-like predicted oxidoreductase